MIHVRAEVTIAAEPTRVWDVLADHENMHKWTSYSQVVRCRPGIVDPNGVGAVRRLSRPGRSMEERITRFEPGSRLEYDVLRGAPGWAPRGQLSLTPAADGGTLLCWTISVHPYVSSLGWLVRRILQRALDGNLARLKARLEPEPLFALERAQTRVSASASAQPSIQARQSKADARRNVRLNNKA